MKKQAVIFDFDGVIAHTSLLHIEAWQKAFREVNHEFTHQDYLDKASGWGREQAIKNVLPKADEKTIKHIAAKKHEHFASIVEGNKLLPAPGVVELLLKLKEDGFKLAVASSSRSAPRLLERLDLRHFFSVVVSADDVTHQKPHPELFLTASERLGVPPQACVVIEDALSGIQAAKAAHMDIICVLSTDKSLVNQTDFSVDTLSDYRHIAQYITSLE